MDFTNPIIYGVPCFLGLILLEFSYSKTHDFKDLYNWKDLRSSLTFGVGSAIIAPLLKTISAIVIFNFIYEVFNPEVDGIRTNIMGWESFGYAWYVWIICQLLDDFSYYWFHRQNHMVRFLWGRAYCAPFFGKFLTLELRFEMVGLLFYISHFSICGFAQLDFHQRC